jgi:hypothetical protein
LVEGCSGSLVHRLYQTSHAIDASANEGARRMVTGGLHLIKGSPEDVCIFEGLIYKGRRFNSLYECAPRLLDIGRIQMARKGDPL